MKKSISVILVALSFFKVYGIYEYYAQCNDIVICAADEYSKNAAASILKKCALKYSFTQELTTSDDQTLYILAGDLAGLKIVDLPKYYIVYQTQGLSSITERDMRVLDKASAVWDAHWSNINKYSGRVKHWYYLPNEDYEFVDPVVLSCFLPLRALPVYKELLCHSNVRNTDFSSHIPVLFCHCLMQNPAIMVESGIRWGDGSTISFAKVLDLLDTYLIGLDIEDCSQHYRHLRNAQFILIDDVLFPFYFKKMNVKKEYGGFSLYRYIAPI